MRKPSAQVDGFLIFLSFMFSTDEKHPYRNKRDLPFKMIREVPQEFAE
jgi:hypothetical protein